MQVCTLETGHVISISLKLYRLLLVVVFYLCKIVHLFIFSGVLLFKNFRISMLSFIG